MEEVGFKKDENPYIVFPCSKCKQYMYVKTTQKTKRCLRCGRYHKVVTILSTGEIAKGMTNAVNMVKQKQREFSRKEVGEIPEATWVPAGEDDGEPRNNGHDRRSETYDAANTSFFRGLPHEEPVRYRQDEPEGYR